MALNNFKCNHLMPLYFKGLTRNIYTAQFQLQLHYFDLYIYAVYIYTTLHLAR